VGLAAPAQAATTWNVTVDCTSDVNLPGNPGDFYNITVGGHCLDYSDYVYFWNTDYAGSNPFNNGFLGVPTNLDLLYENNTCSEFCSTADLSDWYFYLDSEPQTAMGVQLLSTNQLGQSLTPVVAMATIDETNFFMIRWSGAADTPPPSWYQSTQRTAADATCEAGWSPSWALWANSGSGGWVCDREEYWSGSGWSYRHGRK
jgi:hypothetical protein